MEYLSLFKANYINDIDEKKLYNDRLNSENTVHFSIKIHDNPSFLCITKELTVLLEEIQFLNSKIIKKRFESQTHLIKTWEIYHSLIEEIMISNEIEGIVSTRKEITELINIVKPKEYRSF